MKNNTLMFVVTLLLVTGLAGSAVFAAEPVAAPAVAAAPAAPENTVVRQADHDALRALMAKLTTAINARDLETLSSCFSREFAFTTIDQTTLTSPQAVKDYYARIFDGPNALAKKITCIPTADVLTRFTDANTGYCYGKDDEVYELPDGRQVTLQSRWTAVIVRENGEWKVAAIHTGVNMMDNPLLASVTALGYKMLAGGVASGLAVGVILMALFRKKEKVAA